MSNAIMLAIDRQNQVILTVAGFAATLPTLYQNDVRDILIQVYDPTGPTIVDMTGYSMRVSVGTIPTGTTPSTLLVPVATLTYDSVNKWFTGQLDCSQPSFTAGLGTNETTTGTLIDVNVRLSGVPQHILLAPLVCSAVVDPGTGGNNPITPNLFYTKAEIDAAFLKIGPQVGKTYYINTPDGTTTWAFSADNNGPTQTQIQPALPVVP